MSQLILIEQLRAARQAIAAGNRTAAEDILTKLLSLLQASQTAVFGDLLHNQSYQLDLSALKEAIDNQQWEEAKHLLWAIQKLHLPIDPASYLDFKRQIDHGIAAEQILDQRFQKWIARLDTLETIDDTELLRHIAILSVERSQAVIDRDAQLVATKEQGVIQRIRTLAEQARKEQRYANAYQALHLAISFAPQQQSIAELHNRWQHEDLLKVQTVLEAAHTQDAETEALQLAQIAPLVQGLAQLSADPIEVQNFLTRMQTIANNPTLPLATIRSLEACCRPWHIAIADLFLKRMNSWNEDRDCTPKAAWLKRRENPGAAWRILNAAEKDNPNGKISIAGGDEKSYRELRISIEHDINNQLGAVFDLLNKKPTFTAQSVHGIINTQLSWIESYRPPLNTIWELPQQTIYSIRQMLQTTQHHLQEHDTWSISKKIRQPIPFTTETVDQALQQLAQFIEQNTEIITVDSTFTLLGIEALQADLKRLQMLF